MDLHPLHLHITLARVGKNLQIRNLQKSKKIRTTRRELSSSLLKYQICHLWSNDQFEANKMKLIWKGQRYGILTSKFCVGNEYKLDDRVDGVIEEEEKVQKRAKENKEGGELD